MAEAKAAKKTAKTGVKDAKPAKVKTEVKPAEPEQAVTGATDEPAVTDTMANKPLAKAGKRSAKAVKEAEEKQAKEERKTKVSASKEEKPKHVQMPPRTKLERAGKKFREAAKLVDKTRDYNLAEALELATKTSPAKFDATVEMHVNLNVDPRQADQNVRDNLVLPAGTGKAVRVAVLAEADDVAKAKKAGADIAGGDDFLQKLDKGEINFDVLIATPAQMPKLGKYARTLGPKGLMPNPKSGTVTTDVAKAVEQAKAGRVEYRVDTTGIIHLGIGKVSFGADKLGQNAQSLVASLKNNKPSSIKGTFIKSAYLTTTMGPSIRLSTNEF